MLHILWLVIRCIGTALAVVLAIVLLAAALVLFCPFRYRAKAWKGLEEWGISGRIGWLFGLVSVTVDKGSKASGIQIRICGITLDAWKKLFTWKKLSIRKKLPARKKPPAGEKRMQQSERKPKDKAAPDVPRREGSHPGPEKSAAEKQPSAPVRPEKPEDPEIHEIESFGTEETGTEKSLLRKENFFKRIGQRITDKCRNIWDTFRKIISTIKDMCGRISLWKDFLEKSQTKAAFGLALQQLLGLLRHAGPQKWEGSLKLGLDDPAATGQVLAVLGAAYPIHKGRIRVTPVWDQKILEGDVRVKGRVYGIALLCAAARLFFNKDVRSAVRWIMEQAG